MLGLFSFTNRNPNLDKRVPMYRLFTEEAHVKKPNLSAESIRSRTVNSKQERAHRAFAKLFSRMDNKSRGLLIHMAAKMANRA
jgi:hypothetical protein